MILLFKRCQHLVFRLIAAAGAESSASDEGAQDISVTNWLNGWLFAF